MKTTEFLKENSVIAQEADNMHKDHEVQMARSQMYSAAQSAIEIHRLLKDISELEGLDGWVASKLTLASEYLETVRDYLKYEAVSAEPEMMEFAYESAEYAVERLIAEGSPEDFHREKEMWSKHDDNTKEYGVVSTAPGWAQGKAKKARKEKEQQNKTSKKIKEEGETGEERDASARRENERYDNARNYQGRNARGDVIRSGGEVVKGNPNPPSLIQRAAGKLGLPNTATDALGGPMYKSSTPKSGGGGGGGGRGGMMSGHLNDPSAVKSLIPNFESKNSVRESATGGASSSSGMATSMSGPAHKPTSGVPKKLGNAHKPKKVALGKGVY